MTLVLEHPRGREPERAWIYRVALGEYLGVPHRLAAEDRDDVRIRLDGDVSGAELRIPDVLLRAPQADWLGSGSLPREPLRLLPASPLWPAPLPVIYGRQGPPTLEPGRVVLPVDLFGGLFFLLSRYEEVVGAERDSHDRFPARASLALRQGFLERPLADEYLELLWGALRALWPGMARRPRSHRILVSHDVDWPLLCADGNVRRTVRGAAADLLRRRDPGLAARRVRAWFQARRGRFDEDPANTFSFLMDVSERHGLQSAFYFIPAHTAPEHDGIYSLDDPWIRGLLRRIGERGHEVGLHASYNAYRDPAQLIAEAAALRRACAECGVSQERWGGRQHYLRWENPTTWQGWDDAGLHYDSTLGFADHAGFRCGAAFEYPVFNLRTRRTLTLRERPLVAMEGSLLAYQGLAWEEALDRIVALDAAARRVGGSFTLLWHNSSLISRTERHMYLALWERLARP